MTLELFGKALLVWVGILVLAVINGIIREMLIIPALGSTYALILSGVLLMLLIVGVTYLALPWMQARKAKHLILIGLGWFCLTLVFEFSFGLLQGKSIPELLNAYTFKGGQYLAACIACHCIGAVFDSKVSGLGVVTVGVHNKSLVRTQTTLRFVCAAQLKR